MCDYSSAQDKQRFLEICGAAIWLLKGSRSSDMHVFDTEG